MLKNKKAEKMATEIEDLLQESTISEKERVILLAGKQQLEKKEYFPKIVNSLKSQLTPLATKQELSKSVSSFYLKLLKFSNHGFGNGLIAAWGSPFI